MKYPVFAIRDAVIGYLTPTVEQSDAAAIRNFAHAAMAPDSLMRSHANDFSLYRIGSYDTESGALFACAPEFLACAADYKEA